MTSFKRQSGGLEIQATVHLSNNPEDFVFDIESVSICDTRDFANFLSSEDRIAFFEELRQWDDVKEACSL